MVDREQYILQHVLDFIPRVTGGAKFYVYFGTNQVHCFEDDIIGANNFANQVNGEIMYEHQGKIEKYKEVPYGGLWGMFNEWYERELEYNPSKACLCQGVR